jgi:hypothetical protein
MDACAHGGLAHAKGFGGAMEASVGDDGEEGFDLVDFHCASNLTGDFQRNRKKRKGVAEFQDDCTETDRRNLSR